MRVLLVGPDLESNLSLRYLASSLRQAGHEPRIGLSMCFQVRAPEFLALARLLKPVEPSRPVLAGGHFASCAATELLAHHPELDLVVIHEGEQALVELANLGGRLLTDAPTLPGLAVRAPGAARPGLTAPRPIPDDLDLLPPPDRTGPARLVAGVPTAYLMGSRGCVDACDYCCIATLHRLAPGKRFRQRAPERVADEMAGLFHQRGVRQFVFHDDNFLVPSYAHHEALIERLDAALDQRGVTDIALVLKCSPRDAERRILSRLKQRGLIRIFMGIESGTQCGLDAIGRKQTVAGRARAHPVRGARAELAVHADHLPPRGEPRKHARRPRLRAAPPRAPAQLLPGRGRTRALRRELEGASSPAHPAARTPTARPASPASSPTPRTSRS